MAFIVHTNIEDIYGLDTIFKMDGKCNNVDYSNEHYCIFNNEDKTNHTSKVIMLIPYEHINFIENIEEE